MEFTTKGFKKPTSGDANDLYQFVGDNMDLLETELDKKSNKDHTHSELHTHSNKAVLDAIEASYTTSEKNKLSGIESGANVNQNAFSNVKIGTDLLIADSVTDTLEIVAGNNIAIVTDSLNDKITISSKDTVYTHPSSHPASIIIQDSSNRFTSDTEKAVWNAKSNLALGETSTTAYRGDRGKLAYDHSQTPHAPSNAQKNSDITKAEIEAKLIGSITTHTHNYNDLIGKPYFAGTSAPVNKNIFWVDTN